MKSEDFDVYPMYPKKVGYSRTKRKRIFTEPFHCLDTVFSTYNYSVYKHSFFTFIGSLLLFHYRERI